MTDMEFAEKVNAHPARQIIGASILFCGPRLQEFFLKEMDDLMQRLHSEMSPAESGLYKNLSAEERAVVWQEFYNRQTDQGLTLAAAILPLVIAARAGIKKPTRKKQKKSSSRSSTAQ